MKRITSLWLTLLFALGLLGGCAQDVGVIGGADGPTDIIVSEEGGEQAAQGGEAVSPEDLDLGPAVTGIETIAADSGAVTEDGSYNTRDTVALYLMRYGTLPQNFITKSEAQALAHGLRARQVDRRRPLRQLRGRAARGGRTQLHRMRHRHRRGQRPRRKAAGLLQRRIDLLHRRPLRDIYFAFGG